VGPGDADERFRFRFRQADAEVLDTHAGIDEHGHGAELEQGEGQREELQTRLDHQHGTHAAADAAALQAVRQGVALGVQLAEREMAVANPSMSASPIRLDDGECLRLRPCHRRQRSSDINDIGRWL
jgi:hypothetical protein